MRKERTVIVSLEDDQEGRTDWARVDALTDEEIEAAVASDPDAELLDEDFFRTAELVIPNASKERVTIRLDRDVVEYFKKDGPGYQSRMNAVLKAFVLRQKQK